MISWADANRHAGVQAGQLLGRLDIDLDRPVDVFEVIRRMGLVLAFAPLGNVSGLYLPGGATPGILIHEGHPRTRQRYTAAHELGHHVFEHATTIDFDLEAGLQRGRGEGWPDHEKEAEAFAAFFLMPRQLVRAGLQALGIEKPASPLDAYALSLWLGTSYTATAYQLALLQFVAREVSDAWAKIPPAQVKRSLAGAYVPDDLRNDVWLLDGTHNHRRLEARPGDRVVLTLEENASTGFSWEWPEQATGIQLLADSFREDFQGDLYSAPHDDPDFDGAPRPRSFVFALDPELEMGDRYVELVRERPGGAQLAGEFDFTISVNPPLHGIQEEEKELAL
jgi:hypothetical protein